MGLGKTVQALAVAAHLGGRTLVVCPASVVTNWCASPGASPICRCTRRTGTAGGRPGLGGHGWYLRGHL
ncbi:SNF2-related protein [Corynebacterium suedekumii]|nr:SNF2-related protein [Corynebacterium suedekumii]